jgi:hypothetical protein
MFGILPIINWDHHLAVGFIMEGKRYWITNMPSMTLTIGNQIENDVLIDIIVKAVRDSPTGSVDVFLTFSHL